ncbi:hypothetical protein CHLRE_12g521750v5 [Chlamydomonas reinhardtii]|uniref:Nucleoporin Nup133/Nup155-like N-terminal domain-containing protein n=1 Tax=Chlamydomonas reinhardtii TaxID=3055 RepID=A0A2K3D472_CHLRE|nr:uncharacterized protein CHLRE_12g521750v5 [Chlamydomonas reinhardtii]PNW75309.1 hypothetical protein CHLRE_12g521750v5 [Chlamydomonas reinhardtii]
MASFFGDTLGAYMLPRAVLELLQQPGGHNQAGVCPDSGFAWLLSGSQLYIWRYREGKEARLRVLTLPRPPATSQPPSVALIAHGSAASGGAAAAGATSGLGVAGPAPAAAPAAADGPLSVAVCDGDGHLTVWLDAHHLAAPAEQQLLAPPAGVAARQPRVPLVSAFAASRLDLGSGPAFLAALSASDGSLHLVQVGSQGIFPKQLWSPPAAPERPGLVGALGGLLSRAYTDAFDPSARYLRRQPSPRPAARLHLGPVAGGGGSHYRLLALTADSVDCWAISTGLRPSEALQWSFLNGLVRTHDSRRTAAPLTPTPAASAGGAAPYSGSSGGGALAAATGGAGAPGSGTVTGAANLDFAVCGQHVAVWMVETVRGGGPGATVAERRETQQHVVQLLELLPEGGPGVCGGVCDVLEGYTEPAESSGSPLRRLLFSPASHSCLLARWQQHHHQHHHQQQPSQLDGGYGLLQGVFGGGGAASSTSRTCRALWSWNALSGAATLLSEDPDTAAVGAGGADGAAGGDAAGRWVVLSATYGVVEIAAVAATPGAAAVAPALPAAAGLDPAAAASHLLDAVLSQAAAIAAAGGNLQPLVAGLERRLGALGALATTASQAATLGRYSTQLLDLLPKQWAGGAAAAAEPPLACLAMSGVLHALAPSVLRTLIENSEKLAVVVALHRLQAHQRDTAAAGSGGSPAAAAALLSRLVAEAGQDSSAREYEVLSPAEIFYARPSASVGHFVAALGRAADAVAAQAAGGLGHPGDSGLSSLRSSVRELGVLVAVAVAAAVGRRDLLAGSPLHLAAHEVAARLGGPDWLSGADTRAALGKLAVAIQAVRPAPSPSPCLELSHSLFGVTDVLLTCFASALAATRDPGARAALLADYRATRSRCADDLLADALAEMRLATAAAAAAAAAQPDQQQQQQQRGGAPAPELLIWQVEALCRAHHCYGHLFEVCEALAAADPAGQSGRLHTHMATLQPEEGAAGGAEAGQSQTLSGYVYGRLLADGRPADLLELPPQFRAGVTTFLQSQPPAAASDLLATHLLRTSAFADAAAVLHQSVSAAAAAGADKAGGKAQGQSPAKQAAAEAAGAGSLGGYRRLLSVARLAARAGGAPQLEAAALLQLRLLGLQAHLGLPAGGPPMQPALLLDEALAAAAAVSRAGGAAASAASAPAKEAAVAAVEVLALMPAAERAAHASKWQLAWKAVYDADGWDDVAAARGAAARGSTSGEAEVLAATAVCRAAAACGGTDALGFGASVVDSAPLDQVARWLRAWATGGAAGGGGNGNGNGGRGGGSPAVAARAPDAAAARRVEAVMGALGLGVEGARARGGEAVVGAGSALAAGGVGGAGEVAGVAGGALDMIVD